ncbi:phage/plasmid primase, P4 family [Natrialbaceae archaeon A-chndr2]
MDSDHPSSRQVIASRFEESPVGTANRYVSVRDGTKACYDHDTRYSEPPEGNYGVYCDADDPLVVLDLDDYDGDGYNAGVAAVQALPSTLEEQSPHGGTHRYYAVETEDDRTLAEALEDTFGVKNPCASWGEVQVSNKYILAAGNELDSCKKEWHDCSESGEGRYEITEDREIATIPVETLVAALEADADIERVNTNHDVDSNNGRDDGSVSEDWISDRLELAREKSDDLDRLLRGDYSAFRCGTGVDRSAAEASLASRLAFWLGGDLKAVERVIDREARTKKWDERPDSSYRDSVMESAEQVNEYYDPTPEPEEPDYDEIDGETTLIDLAREPVQEVFERMSPPEDEDVPALGKKPAIHEFAVIIDTYWHWVYPDANSRDWMHTLYVYDADRGVYSPNGAEHAKWVVEELLGDFADNHVVSEIVSKLKRRNRTPGVEIDREKPPAHELAVGNGILNLKTGELHSHTPKEFHTTSIDVDYNPDAEVDRIDEFLHEIVHEGNVDTLYRLIAHSILKSYPSRKAAMLSGEGSNGKGTYLQLIEHFLSRRNTVARGLKSIVEYRFAAQDLHGKLANLEGDLSPRELNESRMLKKLTGGDTITADVKGSNETIEFRNHASLMFAVNEVPTSPEDSHGWWSRWMYIPFPHRFDGDDETPKEKLMVELTSEEELQGLLNRCFEEIQRYEETGEFFPDAQEPEAVRDQMKNAANPVRDFATTAFESVEEPEGATGRVLKDHVVGAYRRYADERGLPQINENKMKDEITKLDDLNIEKGQTRALTDGSSRDRCFSGVRWTPRGAQLAALELPDEEQEALDAIESLDDEVVEYINAHPDADVYEVMAEFALGGGDFEAVEVAIDHRARNEDDDGDDDREDPDSGATTTDDNDDDDDGSSPSSSHDADCDEDSTDDGKEAVVQDESVGASLSDQDRRWVAEMANGTSKSARKIAEAFDVPVEPTSEIVEHVRGKGGSETIGEELARGRDNQ